MQLINEDDYRGDTYGGELFGYSVAIDGNRVTIGARNDKTENNPFSSRAGSASVYERSGSLWFPLTKIRRAENPSGSDTLFGETVGISGKTVIIGATQYQDRGAAFIYTPGVPNWILQKQLDAGERFGNSVAIENGTAVIGRGSRSRAYTSTLSTFWSDPEELLSGGSGSNAFGHSVALSGDTIVVGTQTEGSRGNAYVYRKINGVWTYKAQLFQAGGQDFFGASVGVDGNKIMIGARLDASQGSASIFVNVSPRPFDFNGGGVSDISVFRLSNSHWYSTDPITGGYSEIPFGMPGDKIAPADFDGDGKSDIAVFRPSEGRWYILNSSTRSQVSNVLFGQSGDVPRPNDFDNDGKADVAIFRPSTSTWWWINSSNQQTNAVQFGQSGDVPLMADFDGDARGELAVFRPASGIFTWFNLTTSQTGTQSFGIKSDIPTPGDFDGDSKTDIAVFRPSTSESPSVWYRINSSNGRYVVTPFGKKDDIPTVADFDGDGESDIAISRPPSTGGPSSGVWYIINSSFNDTPVTPQYTFITFGASGDVPVPAAYLR